MLCKAYINRPHSVNYTHIYNYRGHKHNINYTRLFILGYVPGEPSSGVYPPHYEYKSNFMFVCLAILKDQKQ